MRYIISLLLVIFLAASVVCADAEITSPTVAIFDDAKVVTEVNISQQDILGYLQMAVFAFGMSAKSAEGEVGQFIQAMDLEMLSDCLSDIKYLRLLQMVPGTKVQPVDVLSFYEQNLGAEWNRLIWDISTPSYGFSVLAKPGLSELMVVGVAPAKREKSADKNVAKSEPTEQRIAVLRTVGMANMEKFGTWFGNALAKFSQIAEAKKKEKEAAAATPETETEDK